jgi:hypothetical protein
LGLDIAPIASRVHKRVEMLREVSHSPHIDDKADDVRSNR